MQFVIQVHFNYHCSMNADLVYYTLNDRVGYITLNRPDKRNALSFEFVQQIKEVFKTALQDESCKVIVLKSSAEAFCAGADLAYLQQLQQNTFDENLADSNNLKELFELIYHSPKVVISQVEGPAIAGGCGLATVCDFAFATPNATFGYTEVKIGFVPALVMVFLLKKVNEKTARELLLTGDIIDAAKALDLNLINHIVPANEINAAVSAFATKLCKTTSAQSLTLVKKMIAELHHKSISDGLNYAAEMNAHARQTADCKKGIASFVNKEKLTW